MREKQQQHVNKEARIAPVPATQLCEICSKKRAPERHFLTVPVPVAFMRVCDKDWSELKKAIRENPDIKRAVAFTFARMQVDRK